jgi:putative ATP-binding cassette transporter
MNLYTFLWRLSPASIICAVTAGVISGFVNIAIITTIGSFLSEGPRLETAIDFVALCIVSLAAKITADWILIQLSQQAVFDMRIDLARQILRIPLRTHEHYGASRLLSALTDDVFTISSFVMSVPTLFMSLAIVIGCLGYIGSVSWVILLFVLLFMVFGILSFKLVTKKAGRMIAEARREQNRLYRLFTGITSGIKELILHAPRRKAFETELEKTAESQRLLSVNGLGIYTIGTSWGQMIFFVLIGSVLAVVSHLGLKTASLTACVLTIIYMRGSVEILMNILPAISRTQASIANLKELGLGLATKKETENASSLPQEWSDLEFSGISHSYENKDTKSAFALGPIDLTIRRGEIVFIIGGNGSGKTTLAKLITGLYAPQSGTVHIGGQAITAGNRDAYRQYFSTVFSDFYLFERLFGLDGTDDNTKTQCYLQKLQLESKLKITNGALSSTDLSQGQRKRLALLTVYLEDRPICVFDEWAADQDPAFRNIFYHELVPELAARGKTLILISHDDRYYHLADRLIKLEYGQAQEIPVVETMKNPILLSYEKIKEEILS